MSNAPSGFQHDPVDLPRVIFWYPYLKSLGLVNRPSENHTIKRRRLSKQPGGLQVSVPAAPRAGELQSDNRERLTAKIPI